MLIARRGGRLREGQPRTKTSARPSVAGWRRALAAGAAALVLLEVATPPARAQTPPAPGIPSPATPGPRVRLLSQTSWVSPGQELRLVIATDLADPNTTDVAVSVFPRVTNRAELSASFTGEGLKSALWQLPGGPVRLADLPAGPDGSRTITIPTQDPAASYDRTRARVQSGIYPVEVQLQSAAGDTVDRLVTHLLAPEVQKDGRKLGVVAVLPLSAPPTISVDGQRTGPPDGTATLAGIAAGLAAAPTVPIMIAPTPETLDALAAAAPQTAKALASAIGERPVVARPYVPVRVRELGDQAGGTLAAELDAGTSAITSVLGRPPSSSAWIADEPLDTAGLGELAAAGVSQLVVSGKDLLPPPPARGERPAAPAVPKVPVPVTAGGGRSVSALVADPALSTHTDPTAPAADQPLAAHHLLTELAGIALLPAVRGGPVPASDELDGDVATILPPRSWRPTQAFLSELLTGLAQSPILVAVEPAAAFALASPPPPAPPTRAASRRSTTTTTQPGERSLVRPAPVDTRLGRAISAARATVSVHSAVLPGAPEPPVTAEQQVLVAASADLPVDEQLRRLAAVSGVLEADLDRIRVSGRITTTPSGNQVRRGRDLVLTSRTGALPIGIFNDNAAPARVLLRLSSEKLEFPAGTDRLVTLDRQNNPQQISVRAKTAGAFPLRVTVLSPDGARVLDEAEYRVRSNSLPGVGIAVSLGAGLVLAFWWGKTLLFQPRGAHLRGRR